MVALGGLRIETSPAAGGHSDEFHQPGNAFGTVSMSTTAQNLAQTRPSVGSAAALVFFAQQLRDLSILLLSAAGGTLPPGVVTGSRYAQGSTEGRHRVLA